MFYMFNRRMWGKIGLSALFLFIGGAAFLVFFAISSPEMPPGNLVSTLMDVSAYYLSPENSQAHVSDSEEEWAVPGAFNGQEYGAGSGPQDRSQDISYPVRPGETLSEIALPMTFLMIFWHGTTRLITRTVSGRVRS